MEHTAYEEDILPRSFRLSEETLLRIIDEAGLEAAMAILGGLHPGPILLRLGLTDAAAKDAPEASPSP